MSQIRAQETEVPRSQPPHPPKLGPAALERAAEAEMYLRDREKLERRSVLRGLLLLALLALLVTLYRADADRIFFSGWWRQW